MQTEEPAEPRIIPFGFLGVFHVVGFDGKSVIPNSVSVRVIVRNFVIAAAHVLRLFDECSPENDLSDKTLRPRIPD